MTKNYIKYTFKIIGLITLICSYLILIWNYRNNGFSNDITDLFQIAWIFGIVSLITNSVYAILIDLDQTIFSIFGICGLVWFFGFIDVNTLYGFPSLIIYLVIGIYLHFKKENPTVYNKGV